MDANDTIEAQGGSSVLVENGGVDDMELLPKDLVMPNETKPEDGDDGGVDIKLGPLKFDYDTVRSGVEDGSKLLRLVKDGIGRVMGFTVLEPGDTEHVIRMIWVNPQSRKTGLGTALLEDASQQMLDRNILLDVWGGEPMQKLVDKFGFKQSSGMDMTNRWVLER